MEGETGGHVRGPGLYKVTPPNTLCWAKYGKEPFWPATVQYDRNGEVCVRFLGVPEKSGTVPKKLVVPFVTGFERFAFRCQRGDFIMGVKLALMRLGGDNALPGAERFFEVPKVYKDPDPTVPIKYVDPYGDETLGQ